MLVKQKCAAPNFLEEDLGKSVVGQENYLKARTVKGKGTQQWQQPLLEE
ncbi:MAG: hypothetical protein ACXWPG_21175 [Ktedonobacteraceae bacterium]